MTVTFGVLKLSRLRWHHWLADPVTDREWYSHLFDAHKDDSEFGLRLLASGAR